jgi:hypothetical protein
MKSGGLTLMSDLCFRTHAFATNPEGDLAYCNGMPGSQLATWIRDRLLAQHYACREPLQEDYGWGFWLEVDGCSLWVAVSYARPDEGEPPEIPEWHVGVDHDFPPWALRQWFRRRRGRELEHKVYSIIKEMINSHPEATIVQAD